MNKIEKRQEYYKLILIFQEETRYAFLQQDLQTLSPQNGRQLSLASLNIKLRLTVMIGCTSLDLDLPRIAGCRSVQ